MTWDKENADTGKSRVTRAFGKKLLQDCKHNVNKVREGGIISVVSQCL